MPEQKTRAVSRGFESKNFAVARAPSLHETAPSEENESREQHACTHEVETWNNFFLGEKELAISRARVRIQGPLSFSTASQHQLHADT